ncbi:MAG: hypothetical protein AAB221_03435, partial [Bacteroidota bacterium]
ASKINNQQSTINNQLYLLGESGDTLLVAIKNKEGYFAFHKLHFDKDYLFVLNGDTAMRVDELQLLFTDVNGKEMFTTAVRDSGSLFRYRYIPGDKTKLLLVNEKSDTILIATKTNKGHFLLREPPADENIRFALAATDTATTEIKILYHDAGKINTATVTRSNDGYFRFAPMASIKPTLYLLNKEGDTLMSALPNQEGKFLIEKLPSSENEFFSFSGTDTASLQNTPIIFKDTGGKNIPVTLIRDEKGVFQYEKLLVTGQTAPSGQTGMYGSLEKLPKLYLLDLKDDTLMTSQRNNDGFFTFNNLPFDKAYSFLADTSMKNPGMEMNIVLTDSGGREFITTAIQEKQDLFRYHYLPEEKEKLFYLNQQGDTMLVSTKTNDGYFLSKQSLDSALPAG